jgi:hypothetical protein
MIRPVIKGYPLLLSLIHPRWWLAGSPVRARGWTIRYYDAVINPQERWIGGYRNRGKDIVMESIQLVLDQQSQLPPQQFKEIIRRIMASNDQIMNEVQTLQDENHQLPPELPPAMSPNSNLKAQKQKGSTRKLALTGAEVSER